jgi:hypothetical protein
MFSWSAPGAFFKSSGFFASHKPKFAPGQFAAGGSGPNAVFTDHQPQCPDLQGNSKASFIGIQALFLLSAYYRR